MLSVVITTAKEKLWGTNRSVFQGHAFEVHHASIKRGGYSSQHRHHTKNNDFYVLSGKVEILAYANKGHTVPVAREVLTAGMKLSAEPGLWHRFSAMEDTELIEIYWHPAIDHDDIERHDEGGLRQLRKP